MILKPDLAIYIVMLRAVLRVGAIVMMWGMMNAGVEGRPVVISTDYDNVSFNELISVYKQAYTDAGFKFKKQTTRKEEGRGGKRITELIFEFPNPEYPHKKKGVVSYVIVSPGSATQNCAPCAVYPKVLGGDAYVQYDLPDWAVFQQRMISADMKANDQIRMKLGKSVRPAPAHTGTQE